MHSMMLKGSIFRVAKECLKMISDFLLSVYSIKCWFKKNVSIWEGNEGYSENIVWKDIFNISVLYLETALGFFVCLFSFLNKLQKGWENFKFKKRVLI